MLMPSKFGGKCQKCGGYIAKGEQIDYVDRKAYHPNCSPFAPSATEINRDDQLALAAALGFVDFGDIERVEWSKLRYDGPLSILPAAADRGPAEPVRSNDYSRGEQAPLWNLPDYQ